MHEDNPRSPSWCPQPSPGRRTPVERSGAKTTRRPQAARKSFDDFAPQHDDHPHFGVARPPTRPGATREGNEGFWQLASRQTTGGRQTARGPPLRHRHRSRCGLLKDSGRCRDARPPTFNVASQGRFGGEENARQHALSPVDSFFQIIAGASVAPRRPDDKCRSRPFPSALKRTRPAGGFSR